MLPGETEVLYRAVGLPLKLILILKAAADMNSRTAVQRSTCARMNRARKEHRMILWRIMTKTEN